MFMPIGIEIYEIPGLPMRQVFFDHRENRIITGIGGTRCMLRRLRRQLARKEGRRKAKPVASLLRGYSIGQMIYLP